jgi:hypothetical protein
MDQFLTYTLIALAVFSVLMFIIGSLSTRGGSTDQSWKPKIRSTLAQLSKNAGSQDFIVQKHNIIEADKILDNVLKFKKIKGDTMGERLKNSKKLFSSKEYNNVWEAHKMRNQLVHEIDSHYHSSQLKTSFLTLKSSIEKLLSS